MQKTHLIALVLGASALISGGVALAEAERPTFETLDRDSNGIVTQPEMEAARAERLGRMDTNGDGILSTEEFVAMHKARAERRAERMMARLDADKDGQVKIEELMQKQGRKNMFARADANSDGQLTKEEFDEARARMRDHRGRHGHTAPQDN
jgi:Ca2+-binding EF-hand superfamily protein